MNFDLKIVNIPTAGRALEMYHIFLECALRLKECLREHILNTDAVSSYSFPRALPDLKPGRACTHFIAAVSEYHPVTTAAFCTWPCVFIPDSIAGLHLSEFGGYMRSLAIAPIVLSAISAHPSQ